MQNNSLQKKRIFIDASGVGQGGINSILQALISNWPCNDELIVAGIQKKYLFQYESKNQNRLKVLKSSNIRLIAIFQGIVYSIIFSGKTDFIISLSPSLASIGYRQEALVIFHDFMYLDKPQFVRLLNRQYRKYANQISARKCKAYIFVSKTTRKRFENYWPDNNKKFRIISPASNLSSLKEEIPEIARILDREQNYLVVPAHSANKGYKYLLECYEKIRSKPFIILLAGANSNQIKKQFSFYLSDQIIILNWISNQAYSWLLQNANCMIFLSEYEGFGIPIKDAMTVGLPIIISDEPALIETSDGYAAVCKLSDQSALAEMIDRYSIKLTRNKIRDSRDWRKGINELEQFVLELKNNDITDSQNRIR